ncbi:hypothetical protein M378DRAFT_92832, partial [Amanita muscaria Koide BX008]
MSSTQSDSTDNHGTNPAVFDPSNVQRRTELGQRLVQEAVDGGLRSDALLDNLRNEKFSPREAKDYIDQFTQLSKLRSSGSRQNRRDEEHQSRPISPSSRQPGGTEDEERRNREAAEVAWAVLRTRARQILEQPSDTSSKNAPVLPESLAELFEAPSSSLSIPASVLAAAPHLAKLSENIKADAHLEETQRLRSLYTPDKVQDAIVANAQLARTSDPIPRSIWRQITLDQFVDFEKLFASMDKGYEHLDDIKDFGAGFALVKKEQSHKKRPIRDESEWLRVFNAWRSAVEHLYPHRVQELEKYLEIVTDVFRAAPGEPHRAIQFDLEARDRYSKRPFRMDDRSQLNLPLLAQLFQAANSPSALARRILVQTSGSMASASFVGNLIEPKTTQPVFHSSIEMDHRLNRDVNSHPQSSEPRSISLKRKGDNEYSDIPRFRRRFMWPTSDNPDVLSPAARLTEKSPPLASPPEHLIRDPRIQQTLNTLKGAIDEKPRVVTDHSASGLNDGIPRSEAKVQYDDMHPFGRTLRDVKAKHVTQRIILFKSDVSSAFLNLPAHPIWQIRQTVVVDKLMYIQVQLLLFWEAIRCPFSDVKQQHGEVLKIIGFWIDANSGSISLSPCSVDDLIEKITSFLSHRQHALRDWQRLAGHINWLFNVLPWGRPALT